MSDRNPDYNSDARNPANIPLLHGPITDEEKIAQQERERTEAQQATENAFAERQVKAVESANRLSARNSVFTAIAAIIATFACVGTWYQARVTHGTLEQMKIDAQSSTQNLITQLQHTDANLGIAQVNAIHAGEQATASTKAANAAKSAADTAKESLHLSQGAYLTVALPVIDWPAQTVNFLIVNSGHIASGPVNIVAHEGTFRVPVKIEKHGDPVEFHWQSATTEPIPSGTNLTISVRIAIPNATREDVHDGTQFIIIAGEMTYLDGFGGTPLRHWRFCNQSSVDPLSKGMNWVPCSPTEIIPKLMLLENYPQNELKNK